MARRYWLKVDGQKITDSAMRTLAHAEAAAQHIATRLGKAVQVGYDNVKTRKRTMKRNPDPGSYLPVWREQEAHRRSRLDFLARTKPKRLAKGHTARKAAKAAPSFRVDVNNEAEAWTFAAPTRVAANALARQYRAAGYYAEVSEA